MWCKGNRVRPKCKQITMFLKITFGRQHDTETTYFMKQSPPEGCSCSVNQEIRSLQLHLQGHYRVHKSPILNPFLSQVNLVYIFKSYFLFNLDLMFSCHLFINLQHDLFSSGFPSKFHTPFSCLLC